MSEEKKSKKFAWVLAGVGGALLGALGYSAVKARQRRRCDHADYEPGLDKECPDCGQECICEDPELSEEEECPIHRAEKE